MDDEVKAGCFSVVMKKNSTTKNGIYLNFVKYLDCKTGYVEK